MSGHKKWQTSSRIPSGREPSCSHVSLDNSTSPLLLRDFHWPGRSFFKNPVFVEELVLCLLLRRLGTELPLASLRAAFEAVSRENIRHYAYTSSSPNMTGAASRRGSPEHCGQSGQQLSEPASAHNNANALSVKDILDISSSVCYFRGSMLRDVSMDPECE